MFIGLDPNTAFLEGQVNLDERGFIVTDASFMTSMPGVFAAGDVRAGSTEQLASAAGKGAAASIQIRQYLESQLATAGMTWQSRPTLAPSSRASTRSARSPARHLATVKTSLTEVEPLKFVLPP